jgi:hypothetical protein
MIIELALVMTKQIIGYIYMFWNIITFLLNLFIYSVSYIFVFIKKKKIMPSMNEILGSATAPPPPPPELRHGGGFRHPQEP